MALRKAALFIIFALWVCLGGCMPIREPASTTPNRELTQSAPAIAKLEALRARELEIARLEVLIAKDWEQYKTRPYRTYVGETIRDYRIASYVETWRQHIERFAEANYPKAATEQ